MTNIHFVLRVLFVYFFVKALRLFFLCSRIFLLALILHTIYYLFIYFRFDPHTNCGVRVCVGLPTDA